MRHEVNGWFCPVPEPAKNRGGDRLLGIGHRSMGAHERGRREREFAQREMQRKLQNNCGCAAHMGKDDTSSLPGWCRAAEKVAERNRFALRHLQDLGFL